LTFKPLGKTPSECQRHGSDIVRKRTRLALEKVFRLESGDMTDGREDVGAVSSGSLNAVSDRQPAST